MKTPVPFSLAVFIVVLSALAAIWVVTEKEASVFQEIDSMKIVVNKYPNKVSSEEPVSMEKEKWHFVPGPISMDLIKKNGCVADGYLSGYGESNKELTKMINRSECVYLHRALETWLRPPDFNDAEKIMEKVEKKPVVYGMFLAEAISTWRSYSDPNWDHDFEFEKMCRDGTEDHWEKNSCIPSTDKPEYRRYLKSITHRAMDIGIQSFLFGQLQLQDEHPNFNETEIRKVLNDMRKYAKEKKMQIIIGAQTNDITDERYLRLFDYIEGGVGIDSDGNIEDGACSSRFGNCWALLWNDRYSRIANDVLLHLDWSGMTWDDMGVFARMDQGKRIKTLRNLYQKFTSENLGFMMPFLAVLNHENDGCYGPNKHFYAPSNKFKCKDEDAINKILKQNFASL
ncbi:MAG: hypothetical protein WCX17_04175 [Parcubacteria group bacterium]